MRRNLKIYGYCNRGYDGQTIGIECDVRNGFPGFDIICLPDTFDTIRFLEKQSFYAFRTHITDFSLWEKTEKCKFAPYLYTFPYCECTLLGLFSRGLKIL